MKIIEFAGLPGCGKSTLCESFIKQISGKKIYTYRDIIKFVSTKKRQKIYGALVCLNPFLWKYRRLLKIFVKKYNNVSMQAVLILVALFDFTSIISLFKKDSIVILDEGFIQNITSVAHLQELIDDESLNNLLCYIMSKKNIVVVNCFADINTVIGRLRKRNRGDRFNSIKDEEKLKNALVKKQNNITLISKHFDKSVDVSIDNSTGEALEQLLQKISVE